MSGHDARPESGAGEPEQDRSAPDDKAGDRHRGTGLETDDAAPGGVDTADFPGAAAP